MPSKEIFVTALTDVATTDLEGVGTLRTDEKGKVYRWVKNADTAGTLAVNSVVCYETGETKESIITPATAVLPFMAGRVNTTLAFGQYGWVQVEGLGTALISVGATAAAGLPFIAQNGQVKVLTAAVVSSAANPFYYNYCLNAASLASDATSGTVLFKCF